ncbi:MAG TPA: hypothetical protein PK777_12120, partial [Thermoguttaceae bacterium]|nr:hypothetical protein [Thermoguttaceae bacterium]
MSAIKWVCMLGCLFFVGGWFIGAAAESIPAEQAAPAQAAEKTAPAIVWENQYIRYVVEPTGRNQSFLDKKSGQEQLILQRPSWLLSIRKAGRDHVPSQCQWADGKLTAQFADAQAQVVLAVRMQPKYLVFEIQSASDGVEEIRLLNFWLRCGELSSGISGVARDEQFAVAVRALNLQMMGHTGSQPSTVLAGVSGPKPKGSAGIWDEKLPARIAVLSATASQNHGLAGAKLALVACPTPQIRQTLQEMLEKENAVRSRLGGPWALDAPETRGSYVFATVSEANADEWIQLAKTAGLAEIH